MPTLVVSVSGVRGIVGDGLDGSVIATWAGAFGGLLDAGPVVVGRDSRKTGGDLAAVAIETFRRLGREVWDLGIVPTPTVQLAVETWGAAGGIVLSASHNPSAWNAMKFVDADGSFLAPERFARLREGVEKGSGGAGTASSPGTLRKRGGEAIRAHLDAILGAVDQEAVRRRRLEVACDTGHGAGGVLIPEVAEALGVRLSGLRLEPNGELPENPEPSVDALNEILKLAPPSSCFVGMADPDADRFAVALPGTGVVGEEWTLPLVASHLLRPGGGPLVTNLSTSTRCDAAASLRGAAVFRAPVGEAHVVAEMRIRGALLGGEGNGGVIDPGVHLGRDAAVAFARLCEAEALTPGGLRGLAAQLPDRFMLKSKLPVGGGDSGDLEPPLAARFGPPHDRRDGLRWTLPGGFVHVRRSGTEPIVRAIVETDDAGRTAQTMKRVREALIGSRS